MSGGKGGQTTGYKYYMGMHAGVCHGPVDSLVEIRGGDLELWSGAQNASGQIQISAPSVYGGDQKEGGVSGALDVMMGEATQAPNSYLSSVISSLMPAFRGILSLVFRQGYIGANNPYPKPWSFRVQRALKGWDGGAAWYPEKAAIPLSGIFNSYNLATLFPSPPWHGSSDPGSFNPPTLTPGNPDYYTDLTSGDVAWYGTSGVGLTLGPFATQVNVISGDALGTPGTGAGIAYAYEVFRYVLTDSNGHKTYSNAGGLSAQPYPVGTVMISIPAGSTLKIFDAMPPLGSAFLSGCAGLVGSFSLQQTSPVISMNPAHIVYEVLTNRDWGMGYPSSIIDNTAFTAAADQLYSEGFGLCLLWTRQDSIDNFLQTVMDHIGAVLVQSRTTGLFQLNLIRGGYNPSTLPAFTADNVVEMISYESPSITGGANECVVNWFNPQTKSAQSTTVQALGAVQAQGVIVSQSKNYPGLATMDLASRVAQRDLRATSIPLKRIKLKLDRNAFSLLPGGLFVLSFPAYGIASMVFRIGEVDYGTLVDGAITITAVQDVFALPSTAFVQMPPTGWSRPNTGPAPAQYYQGFEVTYRDLARNLSAVTFNSLPAASGYAGMVAARPTSLSLSYELDTRVGSAAYVARGGENFCPTGRITAALLPFDTSITINSGVDLDLVAVPCAAMIENEIVNVTALNASTGVATIARGCVDTVPVAHAANARIWLYDNYLASDQQEYFTGESVDMQPLTIATGGKMSSSSAPTISISIVERQNLPYPPANFNVNGTRWDQVTKIAGSTVTLSWAERNRVTQMDQMIDNTAGTITPEAGTTYTITLRDQAGTGIVTVTGITGTSWTSGALSSATTSISITLTAVRVGLSSYQSQALPLTPRVGYGFNYGTDYGGN